MAGKRGNNEGTIYHRRDGRWQAQKSMPDGARRTVSGKTREEVVKLLKELDGEAERIARLGPGHRYRTLGDLFSAVTATIMTSRAPRTGLTARYYLAHYAADLATLPPEKLTPGHIQRLYATLLARGLAASTVNHLHAVLHRVLESATRQGVFPRNYCDLVDAPRAVHKEQRALTPEEARALLAAAQGDRLEALFVLALATGMREGELLGLRWDAVDLAHGQVQVTRNLTFVNGAWDLKTTKSAKSRRILYLGRVARAALAAHQARQDEERAVLADTWDGSWNLVFCTLRGTPLHVGNVMTRHFKPLLQRADLGELRFYDLRHTAATLLLLAGIHPKVVSEMLGHASVVLTLNTYSHVTPAMHLTAASAMDHLLLGEAASDSVS